MYFEDKVYKQKTDKLYFLDFPELYQVFFW